MTGAKSCATLISSQPFHTDSPSYSLEDTQTYRVIIMALHYLTFSRSDISFALSKLSQFLQAPSLAHLIGAKRVLKYLKGTLNNGLPFQPTTSNPFDIKAFSDSDWASDQADRRSTTIFVIFLGQNPISWVAKKQTTVSRSSTQARYRALAITAVEVF
ncbi:uncharacterized mitochondrial protein AtMg00810-like [Benincasa hispida]|uniref:uncharacterized mitochondrial protein AtMg00810-like n=1 Tax=Benincasa hispida TaxID=102211 RepID=UPI0019013F60|nr:uncharacterized mitochondrial protein AtMg00810-like [Benincasa hispida]